MSRFVDNVIALRILHMLVTPFDQTEAFKLGIIDAKGKDLRKANTLKTPEEKDAYTYLDRLVFNMKRIINRVGNGENKLKSLVAALWLVKEYYESGNRSTSLMEEKYKTVISALDNNVVLAEEEILVNKFFKEEGEGGVANVTGAMVSTDQPKIDKKNINKYRKMARRKMPPMTV